MSNEPFNNAMFRESTIDPMHPTMERLYQAAKELQQISGQSELARALNVSPQTVNNWETRGISKAGLLDAQRVIGVSAVWLSTGEGDVRFDKWEEQEHLRHYLRYQFSVDGPVDENEVTAFIVPGTNDPAYKPNPTDRVESGPRIRGLVPLISWVQAGEWVSIVDNFSPGDAEDWMPCPRRYGARTFALRVRGVSMEPRYQDGDIIFVDPDAQAEHGKNVVVRLDDEHEATFKQLVVEGEKKFLKPLNPDWPGPKLIQINGNATICGVVIGKWVPE